MLRVLKTSQERTLSSPQTPLPPTTSVRARSGLLDLGVVAALAVSVALFHFTVTSGIPTGPDAGNWLAMAQDLLGRNVMSAEVLYPPVFPWSLAALLTVAEPLTAMNLAAIGSKVALTLSVYLAGRSMGRSWAAVAAIVVSAAGAQLEAFSWGAYPQTLATAFALISVTIGLRFLASGKWTHFWIAVIAGVLTAFTHLLIGGLLMFALPIAVGMRALSMEDSRVALRRGVGIVAPVVVLGGSFLAISTVISPAEGFQPPVNPLGLGNWAALNHVVREAPALWLVVVGVAVWYVIFARTSPRLSSSVALASAWVVTGVGFFLVTGENRSLLVSQIGLVLLAVEGFRRLYLMASSGRAHWRPWVRMVSKRLALVLALGIAGGIVAAGIDAYFGAAGWFRVVEEAELQAFEVLERSAEPGDLAIASAGVNGHPIGWSVEGYAGVSTYTGVDTRWLAFPEEREQAEIANAIFSGRYADSTTRAVLDDSRAGFLIVDRRGADAGWLESPLAQSLPVIHDSGSLVILEAP